MTTPSDGGRPPASRAHLVWLAIAVVATYASAVAGEFVWLDHAEIEDGAYRIVSAQDLARVFTLSLEEYAARSDPLASGPGGYWRPIYALSISLDWALWGARPALYHAENVLWHLAVVLGLYALGLRLFGALESGRRIAFGAALLFAVHPLGVQSVTWISGRKDALCAAFAVASLLAFFRGVDATAQRPARLAHGVAWWGVAAVAMALAAGSKELGLLVPLAAAGLWWTAPGAGRPPGWRGLGTAPILGLALLFGTAGALALYRVGALGIRGLGASYPAETLLGNLATSATLWCHYAARVLLPAPPRLSDAWPIAHELGAVELLALVALALAAAAIAHAVVRRRAIAPALVWAVVFMLPASGLVPLRHFRAERYLYPASWGLLAAALILLLENSRARRSPRFQTLGLGVVVAVAVAAGLVTARANTRWWSHRALFEHAVAQDPAYVEGHVALARVALIRGDYEAAARHSQRAVESAASAARTSYWAPFVAHHNYALALAGLGRTSEALREFEHALRYQPRNAVTRCHAGAAAFRLAQYERAREHFARSVAIDPSDSDCVSRLAATHRMLGNPELAVALTEDLVRREPGNAAHREKLAKGLLGLERFEPAAQQLARLVELRPKRADLRALWAWALYRSGRGDLARRVLARAREADPDHPVVRRITTRMRDVPVESAVD